MNDSTMQLHAYSPTRPLLLVADYPADTPGGGAEVVRSLLNEEDRTKIIWITPSSTMAGMRDGWRGHETLYPEASKVKLDLVLRAALNPRFIRLLVNRLVDIVERENAGGVWIIMQGTSVFLAAQLLRQHAGRLPTHLSVHDDPVNYTLLSRRRFFLAPLVKLAFSRALRQAKSVDVISYGMAIAYAKSYGVSAGICHRGVNLKSGLHHSNHTGRTEISIGILGNTYGSQNVTALLEALVLAQKRMKISARVVLIGQTQAQAWRSRFGSALTVDAFPYEGESTAVDLLSQCFALYLTYPFARLYRTLRTSSFPTKLSTYGLASRPLLLHAPADSQIMQLTKNFTYAASWTNLRPAKGSEILIKLWQECTDLQNLRFSADSMLRSYFDLEINRQTLLGYLNALQSKTANGN